MTARPQWTENNRCCSALHKTT